ncbi:MAG: hypothetical protein LBC88_02750 [Spirochaetaceae bacterium]|nr:hypothetical protein [Spirochaetaceae bacterium]
MSRKIRALFALAAALAAGSLVSACVTARQPDLSGKDILAVLQDVKRHNSFAYLTRASLPASWFDAARESVRDPFVYIVLSDTKSGASRIIGLFTGDRYNHVSLAFDAALSTLVSYNGGVDGGTPGLNAETTAALTRLSGSSYRVYRLPASAVQKERMIRRITAINGEGSSYNLLGLITRRSALPNIMFCSQFVAAVLAEAGLDLFDRESACVRPMDFARGGNRAREPDGAADGTIFFEQTIDSRSNISYVIIR